MSRRPGGRSHRTGPVEQPDRLALPAVRSRIAPAPATLSGFAAAALLGAVATGEVALVALASPLAVAAVAGLARRAPEAVGAEVSVDDHTVIEGDAVTVRVDVEFDGPVDRLEVALDLDGARPAGPIARALAVPAERAVIEFAVPCTQWGVLRVRAAVLRWRDRAGVVTRIARCNAGAVVRVLPAAQALRTLVRHDETQVAAGNAVARELGQGLEFGDVRPYAPGDRLRAVNWKVSARRQGLWVTDRHLERNVDVVIAVDAVLPGALVAAVRAAAAITHAYLDERDRVGLLGVGGTLRLIRPGSASVRYQIIDALLTAQALSVEAPDGSLPFARQAVPPGALVIAVSSLLDDRAAAVLAALRERGCTMVVVEVDDALPEAVDAADRLGDALLRLSRDARRERLRALGVAVARWKDGEPLETAMAEIAAFRRALRRPGS